MGIYLDPGNENFRRATTADIYVDKTMMIAVMNSFIDKGNNYVCISRPRRFGKTMAGNMLSAYYSRNCDSRALFAPFKIASAPGYADKLNRFHVIKVDMNSELQNVLDKRNLLSELTAEIKAELGEVFPSVSLKKEDSLARSLLRVYSATGETFILLIDEYDAPIREQVDSELFSQYMSFLNGLFKSDTLRPAISLAYLTGILPIVRDKVQSKLNNFREYTILNAGPLSEFVGFTAEETEGLCARYQVSFEDCRRWYDGYQLGEYELYNPESVVRSMENRRFGSYWGQTSSYEAISDRIRQNFAGTKDAVIQMLAGEEIPVDAYSYLNTLNDFSTKDDIFCFLMHLGYLSYNQETCTCRIPNKEVREEWIRALNKVPDEYAVPTQIIRSSKELLEKTFAGDEQAVAQALDISHIHVTSNRSYNNKDALQSAICLAYLYALNRYTIVREMTAGKGFADVVFIPVKETDPAMIIELKHNGCSDTALNQIRKKKYFQALEHYHGNLLFVGINFDEKR